MVNKLKYFLLFFILFFSVSFGEITDGTLFGRYPIKSKKYKYVICEDAMILIKESEGLRLEAYRCPAGVLTIGYGTTGSRVYEGQVIDKATAIKWLNEDVKFFRDGIMDMVEVPLNDYQLGALTSLAYNVGLGALKDSIIIRLINDRKFIEASNEFPKWCWADGKQLRGLKIRREKERKLFLEEEQW